MADFKEHVDAGISLHLKGNEIIAAADVDFDVADLLKELAGQTSTQVDDIALAFLGRFSDKIKYEKTFDISVLEGTIKVEGLKISMKAGQRISISEVLERITDKTENKIDDAFADGVDHLLTYLDLNHEVKVSVDGGFEYIKKAGIPDDVA